MTIHRSNKIRIYPTPEQESILRQRLGASRFVWNWCLAKWDEEYKAGNKPTAFGMAKLFRANKPEWFIEMDQSVVDCVMQNLGAAFKNFFAKRGKYPKFKKKGLKETYQVRSDVVKLSGTELKLPKMQPIKMAQPLFRQGKLIGNVTVSITAGRWYAAIPVEMEEKVGDTFSEFTPVISKEDMISASKEDQSGKILTNNQVDVSDHSDEPHVCDGHLGVRRLFMRSSRSDEPRVCGVTEGPIHLRECWRVSDEPKICDGHLGAAQKLAEPISVGIDLGITTFATLSTGEKIDNPKHFKQAERRLAIRQRRLSKKEKGSKNREKAKAIVARTHAQVANKRKGFLHQTTTDIAKRFDVAVIEDLNVEGMLKNRHLSKAISGASFSEFRRQLEYKMKDKVFVVDRWFPSSKTCSDCGHKVESLPLSVREWTCPECGSVHDRDVNAAKNLLREFEKTKEN